MMEHTTVIEPLDAVTDASIRLRRALDKSVHAQTADALMLSGGIDSGILAALDPTIPAFTTVLKGQGADLCHAQIVTEHLGMQWYGIEISETEALDYLKEIVWITRSYDPALLNDIALFAAMKHAASMGARIIRTGDFSDSLFAGYEFLWNTQDLPQYLKNLLPHLTLASSRLATAMELQIHFPYLHPEVIDVALSLSQNDNLQTLKTDIPGDIVESIRNPNTQKSIYTWSKITLRRAALSLLPLSTVYRTKTDLEFGSGMHTLEKCLEGILVPEQIKEYENRGKRFWNQMHAGIYSLYESMGLHPTPPQTDDEYACSWCESGIPNGRHHCITCGAYPADHEPHVLYE